MLRVFLLGTAVIASAARGDLYTVIQTNAVPAINVLKTGPDCVDSTAISGGVDADVYVSSAPRLSTGSGGFLNSNSTGTTFGPMGWIGLLRNETQASHTMASVAICSSLPALTIVSDPLVIGSGASGSLQIPCPAGSSATGGGVDLPVTNLFETASGPVFYDGTPGGLPLVSAADGLHPAPIGWRTSVFDNSQGGGSVRMGGVCVPSADIALTTEVASAGVLGGGNVSQSVLCPAGEVAFGGGADVDHRFVNLTANAPLFYDGTAGGQRAIARGDGIDAAPIGWFAAAHNRDSTNHLVKVAAICPEPSDLALGQGAALALALVHTRRRREAQRRRS